MNPGGSTDEVAKRAFETISGLLYFFKECFGRNSIDGAGKTILTSIHFSAAYGNAYWDGAEIVFGDGDGLVFLDFTSSDDFVGHELMHGVTQHLCGLGEDDEPGALNESASDVFGSMFRQWRAKETVDQADWLIGSEMMGPLSKQRGWLCVRDVANPTATHAINQQIDNYSKYLPHGDPHVNCGISSKAFHSFALAIGGHSWDVAGKVWYAALTGLAQERDVTIKKFGASTVQAVKDLFFLRS